MKKITGTKYTLWHTGDISAPRRRWLTIEGRLHSFPEDVYADVMEGDEIRLAEHLTSPNKMVRFLANIRLERIRNG